MGGSGGGASGKMSWPQHMNEPHHMWLDGFATDGGGPPSGYATWPDIGSDMITARDAGNPFTGAVAYSPDIDILNAQDAIDDFNADIGSGWTAFLANSMAGIDAAIATPVEFNGMENVATDRIRRQSNKEISRFNGQMLDIGAIQNSTYLIALVQQDQDTRDRVTEWMFNQEEGIRTARFGLLNSLGMTRLDASRALMHQQGVHTQLTIVAKGDEQQVNQQWENAESTWNLELYQYGSNMLAAISGGVKQADGTQTALQKGLSAVTMGAGSALALGAAGVGGTAAVAATATTPAIAAAPALLGGPVGWGVGAVVAALSFFASG